jgi:hypothetical protein
MVTSVLLSFMVAAATAPDGVQRASVPRIRHFPFPFVDEAGTDPEFKAFRDRLEENLKASNHQYLSDVMEPSLGAHWRGWLGTIAYQSQRALALGGSFTTTRGAVPGRREFCAPYVYSAFPKEVPRSIEGEEDPWAIIGAHVPVRAQPRPSARVLTYLSWELVKADGWLDADPESHLRWVEVDLLNGRRGYVQEGQIRHNTDYHVCFAKIQGQWLMTAFARDKYPARDD